MKALVTGASSGIGRDMARVLAKKLGNRNGICKKTFRIRI